jgi:hypothetical protein
MAVTNSIDVWLLRNSVLVKCGGESDASLNGLKIVCGPKMIKSERKKQATCTLIRYKSPWQAASRVISISPHSQVSAELGRSRNPQSCHLSSCAGDTVVTSAL